MVQRLEVLKVVKSMG